MRNWAWSRHTGGLHRRCERFAAARRWRRMSEGGALRSWRHLVPGLLLTLLMGWVGRLLLLLRSRSRWIPIGRLRIAARVPLVGCPRRSSGRDARAGWSGRPWWAVVRAPLPRLRLGTLRRVLAAVLALVLPTAGIHWSLLVGRVRLLVLLKVGMPPGLVGLILPVVIRLGRLRWRSGVTSLGTLRSCRRSHGLLSRTCTWSSCSTWTSRSTGWSLLPLDSGSGWPCRWRLRRTSLTLAWAARWLLLVGSLLRWWRIRTTSVASSAVRVGSGSGRG